MCGETYSEVEDIVRAENMGPVMFKGIEEENSLTFSGYWLRYSVTFVMKHIHMTDGCIRISHDAGWSSLVARWAHNPKVVGSNPAPATKIKKRGYEKIVAPFFLLTLSSSRT